MEAQPERGWPSPFAAGSGLRQPRTDGTVDVH